MNIDMLLIGGGILAAGIVMGRVSIKHLITAKTTTGKIIRLKRQRKSSSGSGISFGRGRDWSKDLYAPVVRYEVDGKPYLIESSQYQSKYYNKTGCDIQVHYNPKSPSFAFVGTVFDFMLIEIVCITVGGLIFSLSFFAD